ncbi:MAG: nucleoside hydrolase [Bacteroidales bacterium]|nr:nucleoside hydrolase [Bacteroidales bacterium]
MKKTIVLILGLMIMNSAFSHYKARYHVIIDTDGGIDDFRAICMMLATPEIEVIAITAVDGILPPEKTAIRVSSLLKRFGHEGIPVGIGGNNPEKPDQPPGAFQIAGNFDWGEKQSYIEETFPPATRLIVQSIELEEMPVDFIALGPLTNLAEAIRELPALEKQIRKVSWYNGTTEKDWYNHKMDPGAASAIKRSALQIDQVSAGGSLIREPAAFVLSLDTLKSQYGSAIFDLYRKEAAALLNHYMGTHLGDDCIPLFLLYPEFFMARKIGKNPERSEAIANGSVNFQVVMLEILDSNREDKSIIFSRFPIHSGFFEEDVAALSDRIIEHHGLKEWKVVVLTNEFHEHLGIYSIIGAKMGLRAREYFNVGIDELTIESLAGSSPPVSCMNDGLQASTGATLGHGTITVRNSDPIPSAIFTFKNTHIEIRVRKAIRDEIRKEVQKGVRQYGLDSPEYWTYIRELALKYWLELGRREIFEIRSVSAAEINDPFFADR